MVITSGLQGDISTENFSHNEHNKFVMRLNGFVNKNKKTSSDYLEKSLTHHIVENQS